METFTTLLPLCVEFTGHQWIPLTTLHWRHNDHDSVSNHQPHGCLLNRLFRSRSKKTSKLRVTGLCVGNSPGPVNSPHKGPVTRKMFPFDDVIMKSIMWVLHYNKANILFPKNCISFWIFSSRQWQLMVDIDDLCATNVFITINTFLIIGQIARGTLADKARNGTQRSPMYRNISYSSYASLHFGNWLSISDSFY